MKKRSRKLWIAEQIGCDVADVEDYQKGQTRIPLFLVDGTFYAVRLGGDSSVKYDESLGDRIWSHAVHRLDDTVIVSRSE
jgi:hypothetical protein